MPSSADKASIIDPNADPYGGLMQSRDLREIASVRDPIYRAKSDILALNPDGDLYESLTLSSQTAWNWDEVHRLQDFNGPNTQPIYNGSSSWACYNGKPSPGRDLIRWGLFRDPQSGRSHPLATSDVYPAYSKPF